jgi:hypothetical protein
MHGQRCNQTAIDSTNSSSKANLILDGVNLALAGLEVGMQPEVIRGLVQSTILYQRPIQSNDYSVVTERSTV